MRDLLALKGRLVVARDEGIRLGVASGFVVDEAEARISALIFHKKWRSHERWVPTSEIVSVGPDLVVISSERAVQDGTPNGRRLAEYRGRWVTTSSGDHLGRLADVGTVGSDWVVNRLEFEDGSSVDMDGSLMIFGRDEILTPDGFEKLAATTSSAGFGSRLRSTARRVFGNDGEARSDNGNDSATGEVLPVDPRGPVLGPEPPNTRRKEGRHDA